MKQGFLFLLLAGLFIFPFSCVKYEEGSFSLRTKKGRLSNHWVIEKAFYNQMDQTDLLNLFEVTFEKTGSFVWNTWNTPSGDTILKTGIWEITSNGEQLVIAFTDSTGNTLTDARIWKIIRLQTNELWVRQFDLTDSTEFHFVPKE